MKKQDASSQSSENSAFYEEGQRKLEEKRQQIIAEAKGIAEKHRNEALAEIEQMKQAAEQEIQDWWTKQREEDERRVSEIHSQGLEQGYQEGLQKAEAEVQEQYRDLLETATRILERSYELKNEIIQKAEPFIVELSSEIAQKILNQELSLSADWCKRLVRTELAKHREKGSISVYVAPSQFQQLDNAKDELALVIGQQAELKILPDSTVADHGCIIRTSLGSVDARIETQLTEIKQALLKIAEDSSELVEQYGQTDLPGEKAV